MRTILEKFFLHSKNFQNLELALKNLKKNTEVYKIFDAIETFSNKGEIRYVGGCIRKIINNENVDDIDLATNLIPSKISQALKKKNIKFYETGIDHGTVTAVINNFKFEITSLRKDVSTDGRHAKVRFSEDWHEDASRRDFTINSIYADINGNLYDPFNGKKDLEKGEIKFIGEAEKRIKEDYLRVLRYIRFFLNYSKKEHDKKIISIIKQNLEGVSKISPERLLDEFKKLTRSKGFLNLPKDKDSYEIISLIFPQFKNIHLFKNQNNYIKENIDKVDFALLISLIIIDGTDNPEYFLYKFNLSKKDQKRILFLNNFFSSKIDGKTFSLKNLKKIFYFEGKKSLMDLLFFQMFRSKKVNKKILNLINFFKDKEPPLLPLKATTLMTKYNIPEGKELGKKLKMIEERWVNNNFEISEKEVQKLISN
jgi:poly(A) polymerase